MKKLFLLAALCLTLGANPVFALTDAELNEYAKRGAPVTTDNPEELRQLGLRYMSTSTHFYAKGHDLLSKAAEKGDVAAACYTLYFDQAMDNGFGFQVGRNFHVHPWVTKYESMMQTSQGLEGILAGDDYPLIGCVGYWAYKSGSKDRAIRAWEKAAAGGDAMSQLALGSAYLNGAGVAKNREKALQLWREAAKTGNSAAMHRLGLALTRDSDGKKALARNDVDFLQGVKLLKEAANLEDGDAAYALYKIWQIGDKAGKNTGISKTEALDFLKKAAQLEYKYAMFEYGSMLHNSGDQNGAILIEKAADAGYDKAEKVVGNLRKRKFYKKLDDALTPKQEFQQARRMCLYGYDDDACFKAMLMKWQGIGTFRDPHMAFKLADKMDYDRGVFYMNLIKEYDLNRLFDRRDDFTAILTRDCYDSQNSKNEVVPIL